MSKIRSPNYPVMDLGAALEAMRPVYKAEHRNKMSRDTLARHLGYSSLNGRALGKIGAVRAYGLIEGTGDALWVADDTITVLTAPEEMAERVEAMKRRAFHPTLFQQIGIDESGHLPSETNLKFRLVKKGFTEEAAGKAAACYLATMKLVGGAYPAYNPSPKAQDEPVEPQSAPKAANATLNATLGETTLSATATSMVRREVITLDEGDVVITFPEDLSAESFGDLKDHLDLFVKKMQRRAGKQSDG